MSKSMLIILSLYPLQHHTHTYPLLLQFTGFLGLLLLFSDKIYLAFTTQKNGEENVHAYITYDIKDITRL